MKRDQKSFDVYNVAVGALALIAIGIFVVAIRTSGPTRVATGSDEYLASVEERIRPFGQVYLPGEEHSAPEPVVPEAESVEPVETALSGPQVYNEACIACHGAGIGGAPTLEDTDNWVPRLAQGADVLHEHAIDGYTGSAGYMPPKGARMDLSDEDIAGAVDYMIGEVQN